MDILKGLIIFTLLLSPFVGLATAVDFARLGGANATSIVGGLSGGLLFWGISGLARTRRHARGLPQQGPAVR